MNAGEVVVLGSANLDLVAGMSAIPAPGETVLATTRENRPGGKGLNQAVAAARAGAPTRFLAAVWDDPAAGTLLGVAEEAGIDTSGVRRIAGASGTAWIMVQPDGENAIVVDGAANTTLRSLTAQERATVAGARILVMQLETPLSAVTEAGQVASEAGVTVLLNASPARPLPQTLLELVDVLVVNEHEARQLSGADGPERAATALLALTSSVVVTLGADGVLLADRNRTRRLPGHRAEAVDTTGAGDAFTGVLAATLASGATLEDAAARAIVAGALAVEKPGAVPSIPTADEIDARQDAGTVTG